MQLMAKKKQSEDAQPAAPPKGRHKYKAIQFRPHTLLREQLEILCEQNASSLTAELTIALREHLRRAGLWPPKQE